MTTQKNLYGEVVTQLEDERVRLFVSGYTRDLCRKIKCATPLDMMEAVESGAKILVVLNDVVDQEDMSRIRESKDKKEILNILSNALQSYIN